MRTVVILQRDRYMEKIEAPECCLFHWRYNGAFANRVRVDAEWNSDHLRRTKPGGKSDRPGESFL